MCLTYTAPTVHSNDTIHIIHTIRTLTVHTRPIIPIMHTTPYHTYENIIATPPIHTIPNIHAIHTIPTLHRKHSIPIIVTIHTAHTIQTIHTVISNIPYPTDLHTIPTIDTVPHPHHTTGGGKGTVLWLTHEHGRGGGDILMFGRGGKARNTG